MKQEKLNTPPPLQADNKPVTVKDITYQARIALAKVKQLQAKKNLKSVRIPYGESYFIMQVRSDMPDSEAIKIWTDSRKEQYKFWN